MDCRFLLIFLLFLLAPANALFLAGQTEQGGEISVLCEGQSQAFLSLPTGELRALALDSDFQASFSPAASGPYTIQCGNETRTISVSLPAREDSGAYSSEESFFLVAGVAAFFLASLLLAAKIFLKPRTIFSKSVDSGRARIYLCAGEALYGIKITDLQGGIDGAPLSLSIPHLAAGAEWSWEYEISAGEPVLAARLAAKCAKGSVSLVSGTGGNNLQAMEKNKHEKRKLPRHAD